MINGVDVDNLREVIKAAKKNLPIQASLQNILRVVLAYEDMQEQFDRRAALMHRYCDAVDNGKIKAGATYRTFCQELRRPQIQPLEVRPPEVQEVVLPHNIVRTNGQANNHVSGSF